MQRPVINDFMLDLTVDVQVVIFGLGIDKSKHSTDSLNLLKKTVYDAEFFVVLDRKGKIKRQYEERIGGQDQWWFRQLVSMNKIIIVQTISLKRLHRKIFVKVKEKSFIAKRGEDLKYVETAAKSKSNFLVTYDPHFHLNKQIIKQIPVHIKYCHEC